MSVILYMVSVCLCFLFHTEYCVCLSSHGVFLVIFACTVFVVVCTCSICCAVTVLHGACTMYMLFNRLRFGSLKFAVGYPWMGDCSSMLEK